MKKLRLLTKIKLLLNTINAGFMLGIIALYISVYFIHGLAGAFSFFLLKLVLPSVGIAMLILCVLTLIFNKKNNINSRQMYIAMILAIIMMLPVLTLVNIVHMPYPISINQADVSLTITSPFKEDVKVGWGGDYYEDNTPHITWPSERWAYDLIIEPANTKSDKLSDYGIYDKEIFSPVKGKVIASYDGENDIKPNTEDFISMEGNYIYIEVETTKTFLLLNHLKKDSIVLRAGDRVEIGEYLGRVGNSGSTSEPHLHIHHQRQNPTETIHPVVAEGLPLYFYDKGDSYMPRKDSIIEASTH